jgi:hypothetical protein
MQACDDKAEAHIAIPLCEQNHNHSIDVRQPGFHGQHEIYPKSPA